MKDQEYKTVPWIGGSNIYEVNIRQYTPEGTFNAFIPQLPRLKDMGVDTLWLMPVTPIAQKNKKGSLGSPYACSDYTSVNPEFGSLEDLTSLVSKAHELGFKLIIDWVANHTGWDHVWTVNHPEYYRRDPATNDFKMASGMEDIIELDYSNPELRKAMIEAMQFWVKTCDIDGFRCDLAFWVELDFWKEARSALENHKLLFWLGEFDPVDSSSYGEVFDAAYTWTWMHKTEEFYKNNGPLDSLFIVLDQYRNCTGGDNFPVWFTSNHDENSWNGTEYEKYGEMAKSLVVFSFTWYGLPMIYSGQELPNTKRLEFFERDTIKWNSNNKLHELYKTLSALRKKSPALQLCQKSNTVILSNALANKNCFGYTRTALNESVLVLLNWSGEKASFSTRDQLIPGDYLDVFNSSAINLDANFVIEMEPWAFLVYEKQ